MNNKQKLKKSTVASALLLATSPAWGKGGGQPPGEETSNPSPSNLFAGKSNPLRMASIQLDEASEKKVQTCDVPPKVKLNDPRLNGILSLAFDPKKEQAITLQFKMSNILSAKDERILLLLYSRCLSKKNQIRTLFSRNKLALDVNDTKVLGIYNVPAIQPAQPSTRPSKTGSATQEMTLEVNLGTSLFAQQLNAGNDTFYLQGALLKKADFERKKYNTVNLSQLEAIHVTSKACPTKAKFSSDINSVNKVCKNLPTKTE